MNATNLFERLALGFGDEEPDECATDSKPSGEENVRAPRDALEHGRRDEGDDKVAAYGSVLVASSNDRFRSTHFIQFELALIDVPFALMLNGKISAIKVHETGPQEYAKPTMYSQTMTTATQPATTCSFQLSWQVATMTPMMT